MKRLISAILMLSAALTTTAENGDDTMRIAEISLFME